MLKFNLAPDLFLKGSKNSEIMPRNKLLSYVSRIKMYIYPDAFFEKEIQKSAIHIDIFTISNKIKHSDEITLLFFTNNSFLLLFFQKQWFSCLIS